MTPLHFHFSHLLTNAYCIKANLRLHISEDAGRYLCDFIYFSSLAHLYKQQRPRKVIFFHVPLQPDQESLSRGKELALQLIRAICETGLGKEPAF